MHDIKLIKQEPKEFDKLLKKRNIDITSDILIQLHNEYLKYLHAKELLQEKRNKYSSSIGKLTRQNKISEIEEVKKSVLKIKQEIQELDELSSEKMRQLNAILEKIPNILDKKVPDGLDEKDNKILRKFGVTNKKDFNELDHVKLAENKNLIDFKQASKISGSRFSVLKSDLAQMHRALINFMLDEHTLKNGYKEYIVPELVKERSLYGTGQLPKFKADLFPTINDLWLIPTGEVSLTNLNRESILSSKVLPLRYTTFTNCFRSEAGSAGIDTKGLIREHQFGKVELVSITKPEDSDDELDRMIKCIELMLKNLELPYRVMCLCSGDTGFSSSITYDFEVWMPGQGKYREVSSCSNCKDFQARRMKMRMKDEDKDKILFPHTLNGSGLAIGRIIVAILENYQTKEGNIEIPKVLRKYMGGKDIIK